jgi:hypothetical protein
MKGDMSKIGAPNLGAPINKVKALIWYFQNLPGIDGVGG